MIDGATLTTGRSMRHETLLLVGDMKDAVVVTSALFLLVTGRGKLDAICWGQYEDVGCLLCCWPLVVVVMTNLSKNYWSTVGYANHTIFTRIITYESISNNT
jgi:hypothetical protein